MTPRQGGGWYLTRMTLVCCAADARAVKLEVRGAPAPPADAWVSLSGYYLSSAGTDPETAVPVVGADDVREIDAPGETYG